MVDMAPFPTCCGAKYLNKAELKALIIEQGFREDLQGFHNLHKLGYVFSEKNIKGFKRVCKGFYYTNADETYEPESLSEYAAPFIFHNAKYGPIPYVVGDWTVFDINLVANFPFNNWDIKENVVANLARNGHKDSVAILNTSQTKLYEKLLLSLGFVVVNRTMNLQYSNYALAVQENHRLTLYHRPPTTKEAAIEAS